MSPPESPMTRRQFLRGRPLKSLLGRLADAAETGLREVQHAVRPAPPPAPVTRLDRPTKRAGPTDQPARAFIAKQHCLAWLNSPCTACAEHCPERGAITLDRGRPTVHAEACTGCRLCHEACPAPTNAVMMLPRQNRHAARRIA